MTLTIAAIGTIALIIFFLVHQSMDKKKYQNANYLSKLQQAQQFLHLIQSLNDYTTWVQRDQLKQQYAETARFFKGKTNYYKKEETVKKFNQIIQDFDNFITQYNRSYVATQKEKLKHFFDNIEGKKLDDQQRTAVITDEYANLIIAGAGSGKTLTIIAKVQYLIQQKNIHPSNILLLSFTKKTVEELNPKYALDFVMREKRTKKVELHGNFLPEV